MNGWEGVFSLSGSQVRFKKKKLRGKCKDIVKLPLKMSAPYIGVQGMTPASNSDTLLYTLGDISDGSTGWAPGLPTQATSPSTARI